MCSKSSRRWRPTSRSDGRNAVDCASANAVWGYGADHSCLASWRLTRNAGRRQRDALQIVAPHGILRMLYSCRRSGRDDFVCGRSIVAASDAGYCVTCLRRVNDTSLRVRFSCANLPSSRISPRDLPPGNLDHHSTAAKWGFRKRATRSVVAGGTQPRLTVRGDACAQVVRRLPQCGAGALVM